MIIIPVDDNDQLPPHYKKRLDDAKTLKTCVWCKTPNTKKHSVQDCPHAYPTDKYRGDLNIEIRNAGHGDFALAYIQQMQQDRYDRRDRLTPFNSGTQRDNLLKLPMGPAPTLAASTSAATATAMTFSPAPAVPPTVVNTSTTTGSTATTSPIIATSVPTAAVTAAAVTPPTTTSGATSAPAASTTSAPASRAQGAAITTVPSLTNTTHAASDPAPTGTTIPIAYYDENVQVPARQAAPVAKDIRRGGHSIKSRSDSKSKLTALQKLPLDFPWRTSFQHAQGEVYTNHYQISISPDLRLYKYTIESDLAGRNKRKIRALIKTAITSYSFLGDNEASFATDHFATVIAWKPLHSAIDTQHLQIQGDGNARGSAWQLQPDLRDEPNDVRVKFTYEGIVDVGSLLKHTDIDKDFAKADLEPTKHALNTAISKCFGETTSDMIQIGANKFFYKPGTSTLYGTGNNGARQSSVALCAMRGYYFTVKAGVHNVLLNINPCTSAFFNNVTVSSVMNDSLTFRTWEQEGALRGLRVRIMLDRGDPQADPAAFAHLNTPQARVKIIQSLGKPLNQEMFTDANGNTINVLTHLQTTYPNRTIHYPSLPAVNLGSSYGPKWYAPEDLLIMPYQMYTSVVPQALTLSMLGVACLPPLDAAARVDVEALRALGIKPTEVNKLSLSKCPVLTLDPRMLLIPGHRFGHPTVQYSRGEVLNEASWNLKGKQFYRHQRKSFRFLTLVENGIHGQKLTKGLNTFEVFATNNYAVINRQSTRKVWLNDPKDPLAIERAITAYTSDVGAAPELVLLVLKVRSVEAYSRFKDVVDRTTGCHSICMTERVFEGGIASCMRNIMMKANLKGAGSNHTIKDGIIQQIMSDTLVLGADVTHPSGSSILGCPSIAAIVGSVDDHAGRFLGSMRLQSAAKKEMIDNVESMVVERIKDWVVINNFQTPENIIYYRDGVSEGQYISVRDKELPDILSAFTEAMKQLKSEHPKRKFSDKKPKLTAIVCAKRHHVRFYPKEGDETTRNGNCFAGTFVDDVVTSPFYADFYLQSHTPLQGTARPAHYFVLRNDMTRTVEELRQLTHELCFTYVRTTGAVSYASPAYYADRLCERGRCYLRDFFVNTNTPQAKTLRRNLRQTKHTQELQKAQSRITQFGPIWNNNVRRAKTIQEQVQEVNDRKDVIDACCNGIMIEAKKEFYKNGNGKNPWKKSIAHTMFWM